MKSYLALLFVAVGSLTAMGCGSSENASVAGADEIAQYINENPAAATPPIVSDAKEGPRD
ncbi:hypothetical protein SAMN06265222_101752 [Neorhodopirellula lusitana]|uniref:Secreted protein n=1 Tax=Neorhodopirellula lusitana TaxID=445327 RepID=A0ABY1PUN6_9BACT|nr:hypothetical protein [Neorhodopirellula lusitana]SMP42288.1 hypothetical protein SAMN06265222_101752 [Neorhodopirellula lusitana]